MLSVDEALQRVLENARPRPPARLPLADALGLVLAEDVTSDIDSPPYGKSMVDGYAVRAADLVDGRAELELLEEIMAGALPTKTVAAGTCSRIMTGAPIPDGADAVVMQEHTELVAGTARERVRISDEPPRPGQNILRKGASLRRGDVVLRGGRLIRPAEIGMLAEVGRAEALAIPRVRVAVLSTGNELVAAGKTPAAGQIRNSNGPMLLAAVRQAGAEPVDLGIARDEHAPLRERLAEGLRCDLLIVSGGVSTGVLDLVPGLLTALGVREVFHKIRMKPGKPLWFGVRGDDAADQTLAFGLPGNPVSSFVCFELFVKPAIAKSSGRGTGAGHHTLPARLTSEFIHRGDRPTYHPAVLTMGGPSAAPDVTPLRWVGSADLRGLVDANGLIVFPGGDRTFVAGEVVDVKQLDESEPTAMLN
ncbi:MAG TPA: gephyrin-like molybdotransferase Glp [Pirellulales bacterium]|jgi:molybdopterin molybdotransferase|nr:gephyrin-like molybdotransferase Glp [Pirellulales bacterium]